MPQLVTVAILEIWGALVISMPVWAPTAATYAAYAIVAAGTYASIRSMQKIPNLGSLQGDAAGKISMTRDTVASRRVIYGMARVSGPVIFASTNSSGTSGKNEFLHMIVALAGHEVTEFKSIFFNDVQAWDSGSGQSALFPADKLAFTYKIGAASQTAYDMTPPTEWTSDHRLNSIASVYVRLTADPNTYPNGIPNISATIVGHQLQDENGNNVDYYDNPALILRHYLLNYFGADTTEIDATSFGVAKDACNYEPYGAGTGKRYTCNYTFTLNTKPAKVIEDILKTCYGKLVYTNGKFVIKAGVYNTPTVYLNEDDLIGGINVTTKSSQANAFNSVRGLFIDGNTYTSSFQASDFVPITSSFYLNEDDNFDNPIDIELSGVTDHTIARRIAKLTLLDSRQDLSVQLTTKISGLQLIAGDNVYLSVARYGWTNKVFEVNELTINSDLSIGLLLKETSSDIYDFPIDEDVDRDLSPNTNLPNPFIVQPPAGFSVTETTTIDNDGTVFPSATLNWSASYSGSISDISIEYKETSSADFDALGIFPRTDSTFTTLDVVAGKTYMFRARNFNYLGVFSSYVSQSLKINGDNTAPQTPSSIVATGGTGSFGLTWTNAAVDTDYKFTKIWLNTANNFGTSTVEGLISGTTWNKTIASSSTYYAWLQNIDTSNNTSSVSSPVSAFVSAIGTGAAGPSGSKGDVNYNIYRRSAIVPATPTGNLTPAFWSTSIPGDDGNALWVSTGLISGLDNMTLIGSWSAPERLNGKVSYYQNDAPISGSNASPVIGDLWFDTNDNFKVYRWDGSSWTSVQDGNIAPLSASIVTITASIAIIDTELAGIETEVLDLTNGLIYATGSISNLYTQSYSLSSSYYASSASFNSSINNIQLTYATQDFAISVSAFSSSATFNSATASANSYTDTKLINYATTDSAVAISAYSASVAVTTATGSSNAYTDQKLTIYATTSSAQAYAETAGTASFGAATASFLQTLTSYATQQYAATQAQLAGTASFGASTASFLQTLTSYATQQYAATQAQLAGTASFGAATASFNQTLTSYATQTYAQSIASTTVSAAITSSVDTGIISASVAVTAASVAELSGSIAGEYVVAVTAGNRVAGFKILSSTVSSSFDVQADRFRIYNTTNGTVTQSFQADANGVFIDTAVIRSLEAGKITAGTINAAVKLTAAKLESPEITGSGIMINSQNGMRYQNNNGNFIITGGEQNGENNGAQIDLVGVGGGGAGIRGTLVLSAGNVGTSTGDGTIRFRTAALERGQVQRDGTLYWSGSVDVRGNNNRIGDGKFNDSYIELGFYDRADRATYIDFHSTTGTSDYNARILRDSGANGNLNFEQTGNGNIYHNTSGTGKFIFNADVDAVAFNTTSSRRFKKNIVDFYNGLDVVEKLQAKKFDYTDGKRNNVVGLIAEEVNEVLPEIVSKDKDGLCESLDYSKLTPILLAAIKEQQIIIENLRQRITILERR